MTKRKIPVLLPGQRLTIRGSGSFIVEHCDVDTLGITEEVAREECACTKHRKARIVARLNSVLKDA